jgi:nuclear transport factor 2 (NTF2) superfamily protein
MVFGVGLQIEETLFLCSDDSIALTFQYEYRSAIDGKWYRAYSNGHWKFDKDVTNGTNCLFLG